MAALQKRKSGTVYYLYLDYTENGQRRQESMGLKILVSPKTTAEKTTNQETLRSAESLLAAKVIELNGFKSGLVSNEQRSLDIIAGFKEWADAYAMKDDRVAIQAYNWFEKYCDEHNVKRLSSAALKVSFVDDFGVWLNSQYVKYGPEKTIMAKETRIKIFRKLRKYLTILFKDDYLSWPPQLITAKWKRGDLTIKKPTPTGDQLETLKSTPMPHEQVCKAWLFCINTGFDHKTVSTLEWSNITHDYFVEFSRSKTGKGNRIKLNSTAIGCLPARGDGGPIFSLPSSPTCKKWIQRWLQDAKVPNWNKFTWHSGRHTLGMILLNEKGVDLMTVKELYGHSSVRETEKYVKAYKEKQSAAMDLIG